MVQINPKIALGTDKVNLEGFNKVNKGGVNNTYGEASIRVQPNCLSTTGLN